MSADYSMDLRAAAFGELVGRDGRIRVVAESSSGFPATQISRWVNEEHLSRRPIVAWGGVFIGVAHFDELSQVVFQTLECATFDD